MNQPGPEITDILKRLQGTNKQGKAYDELRRHRAEVLTLVVLYQEQEREEKINAARERLKERLRRLLATR